jgi:hypothetical protein
VLVLWQVKAAMFAAGCICRLSEDFSYIILEVLSGLICPGRLEPQVTVAAIKALSKLDCTLAVIHRVHEVFMDIHLLLQYQICSFTSVHTNMCNGMYIGLKISLIAKLIWMPINILYSLASIWNKI